MSNAVCKSQIFTQIHTKFGVQAFENSTQFLIHRDAYVPEVLSARFKMDNG